MASGNTGILAVPIRGPCLKHAFAKSVHKGEDTWVQQRDMAVPLPGGKGARMQHSWYEFMPGARCTLSVKRACMPFHLHACSSASLKA